MKKVLICIAISFLPACSSIGVAPAQSFSEQLAYTYGIVASVRSTCAQQLSAGSMSISTGQHCLSATDTARASLDAAEAASYSGKQTAAISALGAATTVLTSLQSYLNTEGK